MTINGPDTIRELSAIELDQISGGGCQCGSDGACVSQGSDGVFYTCGGMPLFGGFAFPQGTSILAATN